MSVDRFQMTLLASAVAKAAGQGLRDNPHPRSAIEWHVWRAGFRRATSPGVSSETVTRETLRPGRGRSLVGDRGEWPAAEIDLLERCLAFEPPMSLALVAEIVGRSHQACRNMAHRIRRRAD